MSNQGIWEQIHELRDLYENSINNGQRDEALKFNHEIYKRLLYIFLNTEKIFNNIPLLSGIPSLGAFFKHSLQNELEELSTFSEVLKWNTQLNKLEETT